MRRTENPPKTQDNEHGIIQSMLSQLTNRSLWFRYQWRSYGSLTTPLSSVSGISFDHALRWEPSEIHACESVASRQQLQKSSLLTRRSGPGTDWLVVLSDYRFEQHTEAPDGWIRLRLESTP